MKKWILVAIAMAPLTASADLMRFDFDGTCTIECGEIGLSIGDSVSGFIETLTGLDADNILLGSELSDFAFNFGPAISISRLTHTAIGFLIQNSAGTGFTGIGGITFQQGGNPQTGATVGLLGSLEGWIASIRTTTTVCGRFFCWEQSETSGAGGPGSYSSTAVPEPGTLGLLGIGLLAFGMTRRRRKA